MQQGSPGQGRAPSRFLCHSRVQRSCSFSAAGIPAPLFSTRRTADGPVCCMDTRISVAVIPVTEGIVKQVVKDPFEERVCKYRRGPGFRNNPDLPDVKVLACTAHRVPDVLPARGIDGNVLVILGKLELAPDLVERDSSPSREIPLISGPQPSCRAVHCTRQSQSSGSGHRAG